MMNKRGFLLGAASAVAAPQVLAGGGQHDLFFVRHVAPLLLRVGLDPGRKVGRITGAQAVLQLLHGGARPAAARRAQHGAERGPVPAGVVEVRTALVIAGGRAPQPHHLHVR